MSIKETDIPKQIIAHFDIRLFEVHAAQGRHYLILDLDNTIADGKSYECDENAIEVLRIAKDRGLLKGTCLLSNVQVPWPPLIKRVSFIAKKIRTPHYHAACFPYAKPHPRAVQTALSMMGASAEQTVMIGDQLNKDIRAANAAGIYSILRFPSYGSDPWYRTGKRKKQNAAIEQWLSQQRR